jgi:hypothetical protein
MIELERVDELVQKIDLSEFQTRQVIRDFFRAGFMEAVDMPPASKTLKGEYFDEVHEVLTDANEILAKMGPLCTPEMLMPRNYMSAETSNRLGNLAIGKRTRIFRLIDEKAEKLSAIARDHSYQESQTVVPVDVFDQTAFMQQNERLHGKACMPAVFRMLFQGVTGFAATQSDVMEQMSWVAAAKAISPVFHDDVYLNFFRTETFRALNVDVQSLSFVGFSLGDLRRWGERLRTKFPDDKVFCVTSLQTDHPYADKYAWHATLFLGATEEAVVVHDPSSHSGRAFRHINKEDFMRRWAQTYFRGHFVISRTNAPEY